MPFKATVLPGDAGSCAAALARRKAHPMRAWRVRVHEHLPYDKKHPNKHTLDIYEPTTEIIDPVGAGVLSDDASRNKAHVGSVPRPTVFFVHGGGWKNGDKSWGMMVQVGSALATRGFTTVIANYRVSRNSTHEILVGAAFTAGTWLLGSWVAYTLALAAAPATLALPEVPAWGFSALFFAALAATFARALAHVDADGGVRWPVHAQDAATALAWTIRHGARYGCAVDNIVLMGQSAGGHIAAMLALQPAHLLEAPPAALPADTLGRHVVGVCLLSPPLSAHLTAEGNAAAAEAERTLLQRLYRCGRHAHVMTDAFGPDAAEWPGAFPVEVLQAEEEAEAAVAAGSALEAGAAATGEARPRRPQQKQRLPVPLMLLNVADDWGLEAHPDVFLPLLARRRGVAPAQVTRLLVTHTDHAMSIMGWGKGPGALPPDAPGDCWQRRAWLRALPTPLLWPGNEVMLPAVLAWLAEVVAPRAAAGTATAAPLGGGSAAAAIALLAAGAGGTAVLPPPLAPLPSRA